MEHYHKLKTLKTYNQFTFHRHNSQNLIISQPQTQDKHNYKNPLIMINPIIYPKPQSFKKSKEELYGLLKKKKRLSEDLTKIILKDSLKALDYMHERQIIHRDIKPQNIIFHNVFVFLTKGMIKLCDFGWSISSKTMRQTFCGTPLYVSPELLRRKNYNNKIDVWSIGILTYELLFGRVPFDINTERDFIKIVEDEIKFTKAVQISNEAKEFILICLKKDPRDRYTVAQLLEHPFIANIQPVPISQLF